jgi:hypothetical protein
MDDALFMGRVERVGNLPCQGQSFVDGQRPLADPARQRDTVDQLEDQGLPAAGLFEAVNRRDVGMIESGKGLRLSPEAREPVRLELVRAREHLEHDVAIELGVVGAEHLTHAAAAEQGQDAVRAHVLVRGKRRLGRIRREPEPQLGQQGLGGRRPPVRERGRRAVGVEERCDLAAQRVVAGHRRPDERGPFGRRLLDRDFEQPLDTLPAIVGHTRFGTILEPPATWCSRAGSRP